MTPRQAATLATFPAAILLTRSDCIGYPVVKSFDLIVIYQVETHDDPVSHLLGLLGIQAIIGSLIGINCSPITVVGLGGTDCTQETLCCTGNSYVSIEFFAFSCHSV